MSDKPYSIIPEIPWTEGDVNTLYNFLHKTETGIRLQGGLQVLIQGLNEKAVCADGDRIRGFAQGAKGFYDHLISLATAHSGKSEQPAHSNGIADPLAHLRP